MRRVILIGGLLLCFATLIAAVACWQALVSPLNLPAGGALVKVPAGATARGVADDLSARGVLAHPLLWAVYARLSGRATQIKQGEYRLKPGMTPVDLLRLLVAGKTVQYAVTLIDGWTFRQVMQTLNHDPHIGKRIKPSEYADLIHQLGGPKGMSPEGWFYPNTYFFSNGASELSILRRAYGAMRRYLKQQWAQRAPDLPLKKPYDALILASIVEKETSLAQERPLVASVYINRLRKGMRLQSDPTVIYGLGPHFNGDITFKDLRNKSPYNTYVHAGLPPTPIAIPGPAAIHAALHPAHTQYLYFVAKGNGTQVFSRTYAEQRREVNKYQLNGRKEN